MVAVNSQVRYKVERATWGLAFPWDTYRDRRIMLSQQYADMTFPDGWEHVNTVAGLVEQANLADWILEW